MPSLTLGSPSAQAAVLKIAVCGTWNGISLTRYDNPDRYWCQIRTCPNCGSRWKDKTARRQKLKVEKLLGGDFSNARRVTMNVRNVPDVHVLFVVEMFREYLSKFFERKLRSCVLIGTFDFAFDSAGTVNVHVHATLIDLSGQIQSSVELLEKEFDQARCFCDQPLSEKLKDGRDGPLAWHSYAMDTSVTAYKHHRAASWDHHRLVTPVDHLRWIGLFEDLRNSEGNRIRTTIEFGARKALNRLNREKEEEDRRRMIPEVILDQTPRGETMGGMYYSSDPEEEEPRRPDRIVDGEMACASIQPGFDMVSAVFTCKVQHAMSARGPPTMAALGTQPNFPDAEATGNSLRFPV